MNIGSPLPPPPPHTHTHTGQTVGITWNGTMVANNSLVTFSVVAPRVNASSPSQYPLVCQGIAGGQWYEPNGTLYPAALPITTPGGYGQQNVSTAVELYRGTPFDFPHGVQCCTNTTVTLCVAMYSDLNLAASVSLPNTSTSYILSVAATCKWREKYIACVMEVLTLPQMVLTSQEVSSFSC